MKLNRFCAASLMLFSVSAHAQLKHEWTCSSPSLHLTVERNEKNLVVTLQDVVRNETEVMRDVKDARPPFSPMCAVQSYDFASGSEFYLSISGTSVLYRDQQRVHSVNSAKLKLRDIEYKLNCVSGIPLGI